MYAIRSYYAPPTSAAPRITSYNVCYTKLLRAAHVCGASYNFV
ncbi:hypothetical protein [Streptomyces cyaneogriseus]|nr:hypothetical protein [Streptomyces cyaneogriseus]